ncbi:hypothetical protein [Jannaschia sp. CCS1]|uniref:hypothetical protein n=1 Tax=Jannaschia sp. (strain CCS1) TaxID=290400 RepID=UPI0002DE57B1|nr:hypothetical protein [Jannaschia sp. CCS1]
MANTDSFIDEVSEEVRRDRLYALMRRWGWIPILVVIAIVGGAAYFEWQNAQQRAQAEAFGDALLSALDNEDTQARVAALEAVDVPSAEAGIILALLAAGETANGEDRAGAAARLRAAAEAPGVARRYVDLALLKAEMLDPAPEAEARATLEALAAPGAPYSALAEEQLALMEVRAGDLDAGLDRLRAIERSAAATAGLQQRAAQLIVALESGAVLVDPPLDADPVDDAPVDEGAAEPGSDGLPEDAAPEDEAPEAVEAADGEGADGANLDGADVDDAPAGEDEE